MEIVNLAWLDVSQTGMTLHTSARLMRAMAKAVGDDDSRYAYVTSELFDQLAIASMLLPGNIPLHDMGKSRGMINSSELLITDGHPKLDCNGDVEVRDNVATVYTDVCVYSKTDKECVCRLIGIRIV